MRLSLESARALLLTAQGLDAPPERPATKADIRAVIRRMEGLQIDTISVVARSPYFVLWSRLGAYEPRWLDELLAEGSLFEYWSHAACFLPIEDFSLYRRHMLDYAEWHARDEAFVSGHREAIERVLSHVRETGAVRSAEFPHDGPPRGGWWSWKPEKRALEHLFNAGVLMIARRERFQRVYDLRERVLPDWDEARVMTLEATGRELTLKAVRALGVSRAGWVHAYFRNYMHRSPFRETQRYLKELEREERIFPVTVDGWNEPAYVYAGHRAWIERAASGLPASARTTLLSPFDPVVRDRARARELFEFDYTIETYTPAARRRYGYYVLPILHHGALVGRIDPKAHRRTGLFEVKSLYLEPGVSITNELVDGLAGALADCAVWHDTPHVVIGRSDPPELAHRLREILP